MANKTSRRNFLRTAPVAAAVSLTLADSLAASAQAGAASTVQQGMDVNAAAQPFKLWTGKDMDAAMQALAAKPGDNRLYASNSVPLQITLTTESHKSAPEFEWHEGRDHIVQIIDGSTLYEVGGTPTGAHINQNVRGNGEWLAPTATGSKSILMVKGDMLLIPRGSLHKRSTEDSVTLLLIANPAAKA